MTDEEQKKEQEESKTDSGAEEGPSDEKKAPEDQETTEWVEFTRDQQRRVNRLYGNMKQYERMAKQMATENRALVERLESLEGKQRVTETESAVERLKAQKTEALELGDHKRVVKLDDQMLALRSTPEPEKKGNGKDFETEVQIDPVDQQLIHQWGNELDDNKNFKRPWAQAGHPYNSKAAAIGRWFLRTRKSHHRARRPF